MTTKIQFRRDVSTNWTVANPLLSQGELGLETDSGEFKVGNGVSGWNDLPYSSVSTALARKIIKIPKVTGISRNSRV